MTQTDGRPAGDLTATESAIAAVWTEVLGLDEPVRADDNFFALGGHSMKAMQTVVRLRRSLGRPDVRLADVYSAGTLRDLAQALDRGPGDPE